VAREPAGRLQPFICHGCYIASVAPTGSVNTVGVSHRICDDIEAAIQARFAPPPKVVVHVEPEG